jgi:sec-independent protein translocase protein TatB
MFDIGFSEMMLIAIVALIVIGPQRLPKVARTLGHLFGRMQRYVNDVKSDISREMELDELKKMQASMEETARTMHDSVRQGITETEGELNKVAQSAQPSAQPKIDPYDDPFADNPPPESAATAPASPQAELPLDAGTQPPGQKQA